MPLTNEKYVYNSEQKTTGDFHSETDTMNCQTRQSHFSWSYVSDLSKQQHCANIYGT